jgi:hypothetical protein
MPQAQAAQNDGLRVSSNDAPEVPPSAGSGTLSDTALVGDLVFGAFDRVGERITQRS